MTHIISKLQSLRSGKARTPASFSPSAFSKDEDGAIVAFTLFALVMMLLAGGIGIDLMRQEMNRAKLQNNLDSAVLAAAGAPYGTPAKPILQDFMAKAGMSAYLNDIDTDGLDDDDDIVQTLNTSKVSATAKMDMDTYLMHLSGVKQLRAIAASSAERRVPKLEVSMVLDVSGSMGDNSRLTNLKTAGKEFITSILNSGKAGDAVISIVPFSWDVAPGRHIFEALNVDELQPYSTCLQFSDNDFKAAAIDPDVKQLQLIYTSDRDGGFDNLDRTYRTCFTDDYAEILPYSISQSALHSKIDSLEASGNTSGNMGMKWGAALLDAKFQSVKTHLSTVITDYRPVVDAEGKAVLDDDKNPVAEPIYMVDPLVDVVPAAYDEGETLKVIVMMGDGANTYSNQFKLPSSFRGPNSLLHEVTWTQQEFKYAYKNGKKDRRYYEESKCKDKKYECIYEEGGIESAYYLKNPSKSEYLNIEEGKTVSSWTFDNLEYNLPGFISSEQLSWEMAWGLISPDFLRKQFSYYTAKNEFINSTNRVQGGEKDTQMDDICTAIKDKGVVVYTIGFEVGVNSTAEIELKDCASTYAHYYRAKGINISDAFSSIASNVVNLRLTQ